MTESLINQEIKDLLRSNLRNSFQLPSNDPLANVHVNGVISLNEKSRTLDSSWEKLARTAKNNEKEFGINPLCTSKGVLKLEWKEKNFHFPIVLRETQLKIDRLAQFVSVQESEEQTINPYLIHFFEKEFNITIPIIPNDIFDFLDNQRNIIVDKDAYYIGNFHPHRFEIIREIESLIACDQYSNCLKQVIGVSENLHFETLPLSTNKLVSADPDQLEVLHKIQTENCVVQGPPGTGKSQVIINLLGKLLEKEKTTVVVSEKRVALDVIEKKMNNLGLGGFCYTTTSDYSNTDFISSLKNEWKRVEFLTQTVEHFKPTYLFHVQELQNLLNLLHQPNLANGKSVLEFLKDSKELKLLKNIGFSSELPDLKEWERIKTTLEFIYENRLGYIFSQLKTELIEKSFLLSIESKLSKWNQALKKLKINEHSFTFSNLYDHARKAVLFSKFDSTIFKKFGPNLLSSDVKQRKIQKLKIQLQKNQNQLEKLALENTHWIQKPSKSEVDYLLQFFQKKGILSKFQQSNTWKKWTRSPFLNPLESLKSRLDFIELTEKKNELLIDLAEFGIENQQDLEEILSLFKSVSKDEFNQYNHLSKEEINFYSENQQLINQLITEFKIYFKFDDDTNLILYFTDLTNNLFKILEHLDKYQFTSKYLSILTKWYTSIIACEEDIFASSWSKLKMDFPKLVDFSWENFYEKTLQNISIENIEKKQFSTYLLGIQKQKFEYYHNLLLTSSVKLNTDEKILKQQLREGKRILVKEFAKSRNHLSIRALMESNARVWIQLLKPIWLSNPTRIATCFPMHPNLFSLAIFDEASQIPFENAFGTLQRSKRILIAGDPQQMSPSSFFSGNHETMDLLHQASYNLPNLFLSYHYRSYHPELISFSNSHFYQNRLNAFQHADFQDNPIHFNYVQNAFYDNRINCKEAKEVAKFIEKKIDTKNTLGIVAFSENQLQAIYKELPQHVKIKLQEKIESDEVFFKSIENVQGDECDELIISFGYGFSESEGIFALRFGPMNLSSGSKRLNVLLTRARKNIYFFASVKSDHFKNSSNETINLIRKWFQKIESLPIKNEKKQPKVSFRKLVEKNNKILTINTLISIYSERNWSLSAE